MKILKQKALSFLISLVIFTIIAIIYTILLYNGKINTETKSIHIATFIIGIITFFIYGLITGIVEKQNGFLSSLISTTIILIIIVVIKLLSKRVILPNDWLKYVIYLASSIFGGIIGVNLIPKKKKNSK